MSFEPVYNVRSRALILGTWPSPKSREMAFYYGHPQNRFWPMMAALTGEADISTMPVEYTDVTKKYNKTICDDLGMTVPEGYEAIEE